MPGRRAIVLALAAVGAALPVASAGAQSYDGFDDQSLTAAPVASAGQEIFLTPEFDSSAYTLQSGEQSSPPSDQTTCTSADENAHIFGGRTSWVRFVTRVSGTVDFRADTPGYDSVAWIRSGPVFGPGQSSFSDILNIDCADGIQNAPGGERVVQHLTPDRMFHLQIAGVCARGPNPPSATCPDQSAAPGGATRFRVIFSPDNADGDQVADTLDQCKADPGPPENNGCPTPAPPPDDDGDQVPDSEDDCPGVFGEARPRPRNGCPDGGGLSPEPVNNCPPGVLVLPLEFPGVSINSGAFATKSLDVLLSVAWPAGANEIAVSNDNGGPYTTFPLQRCIVWRLRDTPEGGPRKRT